MFWQDYWMNKLLGRTPTQLMRRLRFRALALRLVVVHPADVPAALAVEMAQASGDCAIYLPLLEHLRTAGFGELGAIDSPVQIVWGSRDRILRWPDYAERFRRMVPGAKWIELTGLGHCPMLDDAQLTAQTILGLTGADVRGDRPQPAAAEPRSR
jgi:pimeloyl-ACP methyl ester carboxylesterase